jgi:hypothetical protein
VRSQLETEQTDHAAVLSILETEKSQLLVRESSLHTELVQQRERYEE